MSEARERGTEAVAVRGDVTDSNAVDSIVEDAADSLGGLDAVVNSAGIVDPARLEDTSDETWDRVLRTNLTGVF